MFCCKKLETGTGQYAPVPVFSGRRIGKTKPPVELNIINIRETTSGKGATNIYNKKGKENSVIKTTSKLVVLIL